jgi:hypothetical protein
MEEHFLTICRTNKSESAIADDALDCALHRHLGLCRGSLLGGMVDIASELPRAQAGATLPVRKCVVKGMEMWVVTHFEVPRPSWPCPFTGGTPVAPQNESLPKCDGMQAPTICHVDAPLLTGLTLGTISPPSPSPRGFQKPC